MNHRHDTTGEIHQCERPCWRPLLDVVGTELIEWFMWMYEVRLSDGCHVHAYKHRVTRRYLHLTDDGDAVAYKGGGVYTPLDLGDAIEHAFGWERPREPLQAG
jgi:hypothetical protein